MTFDCYIIMAGCLQCGYRKHVCFKCVQCYCELKVHILKQLGALKENSCAGKVLIIFSQGYSLVGQNLTLYPPVAIIFHKPIGIYMGSLILGVNTLYMLFCF